MSRRVHFILLQLHYQPDPLQPHVGQVPTSLQGDLRLPDKKTSSIVHQVVIQIIKQGWSFEDSEICPLCKDIYKCQMKINCIYLRRSFGEVKLSSSSRVTLIQKTGGLSGGMIQLNQMPEGQSQMPAGLNQMSEGPSQVPGGLNQSSIKQEGSSPLFGARGSQVCNRHR